MVFNADGTFTARGEDDSISGSCAIDGDAVSGTVTERVATCRDPESRVGYRVRVWKAI